MIEVNKIGLIAGSVNLPLQIIDECKKNNVEILVFLIKGFANKNNYKNADKLDIDVNKVLTKIKNKDY